MRLIIIVIILAVAGYFGWKNQDTIMAMINGEKSVGEVVDDAADAAGAAAADLGEAVDNAVNAAGEAVENAADAMDNATSDDAPADEADDDAADDGDDAPQGGGERVGE